MKQTAPISLDSFDPEVLAAAREVARRAGVPLEAWIASVAKPDKPAPRRRRSDAATQAGRDASRETTEAAAPESSQGQESSQAQEPSQGQEPPRPKRREGGPPREKAVVTRGTPLEVSLDAMMRRLDALDRTISSEREAAKADAARMIGEIETRLSATLKPAASEEIAEAMTERFADIERKVGEIAGQLGAPRPLGRRGRPIVSEMREAVAEVRRRQRELEEGIAGWNAADATAAQAEPSAGEPAETRNDPPQETLPEQGRAQTPPAPAPRHGLDGPSPAIAELQRETSRLRESLSGLATGGDLGELEQIMRAVTTDLERARDPRDAAAIAAPVELMRVQVDRLAADAADNVHARIVGDVERLAARVESALAAVPAGHADQSALEQAFRELDEIRQRVAALAPPERILGLAQGVQAISARIAELQREEEAGVAALRPLLEEIRGELKAPDETRALLDRFEALAERIDRAETGPVGELVGRLETLAEKVDRVSAGGSGLDALERHVLALANRLDAPRGSDPALARLERSMGDLLAQVSALRDGSHLDATVERAAREAAAGAAAPFKAANGEVGLLRADLADLRASQKTSDQRLHATLEGVQSVLSRLSEQLDRTMTSAAALTVGAPAPVPQERAAGERVAPGRPAAPQPPARTAAPAPERPRPAPQADSLASPDGLLAPDELLEPGAGRPGFGRPAAGETKPVPGGADIKTSFIAAARRAALAAQAESVEPPLTARLRDKVMPASRAAGGAGATASVAPAASGPLSRVRGAFESRRRTLLLGLAAVVLALGAYQAFRAGDAAPTGDVAATGARPADAAPAAAPESRIAESRTAESKPEAAPAPSEAQTAVPAPAEPQDPTTTQSIAAKAPETGKHALPPVAGMNTLGPDLAGVPPALSKLKQEALAGDAAAIWDLATREAEGRGVPRDLALAAKLYERLAGAGFAPAQVKTGNAYEKGNGVVRDIGQAKLWYGRAADQGNVRAMHNLAVLHAENPAANGKPDFAAAAGAFRRAAEHGVRDSQYNLAVLYARGLGVGQDLVQSYLWFSAAAAQGDEEAGRKRDEVATKLSPKDLTEAKGLTASFKARSVDPAANEVPAPKNGGPAPVSLMGAPSPGLPNLSSIPKRAGA